MPVTESYSYVSIVFAHSIVITWKSTVPKIPTSFPCSCAPDWEALCHLTSPVKKQESLLPVPLIPLNYWLCRRIPWQKRRHEKPDKDTRALAENRTERRIYNWQGINFCQNLELHPRFQALNYSVVVSKYHPWNACFARKIPLSWWTGSQTRLRIASLSITSL